MVRFALMVGFLCSVSATSCLAAGTCSDADRYISAAKVDNVPLAKTIKCLASGLTKIQTVKEESIHSVEKIQLLAVKIIGNGSKKDGKAGQGLSSPTLGALLPSAPNSSQSVLYAQAIVCEGDKILKTIDPAHKAAAQKGWCTAPKGSPAEIKKYASKIIGNG